MSKQMTETQVAIIGGGITGATLARELSKYKVDVCVLEKESACGFGVTKVCQGLVHGGIAYLASRIVKFHGNMDFMEYLKQPGNLKEKLGNLGREDYFNLAPVLGLEIHRPGRLMLAENQEDLDMVNLIKEMADFQGIQGIEVLDRKALEEREPLVNEKYIGGLYDPNEAVILPTDWTFAMADHAQQNGVHIFKETIVEGIEDKKSHYVIKTNRGRVKAEYVVNAAGLYADEIAGMVDAADFEVTGWKAQLLILENRDFVHHVMCLVPHPQRGRLLIPTTHNSIVVAHSFEPMTHKGDKSTTKEKLDELITWPIEMFPDISRKHLISSFSGYLMYNTKKPSDHLLESPKRGFINAVVGAPGLGPAPAMAREIVNMLEHQGLELTARSDFNPYLTREPRFIDLPSDEKKDRIEAEAGYGHMVCRCMHVSEQEVRAAVRAGAKTVDEVKFRTLAGMGRCQGGFCTSRVIQIMAEELQVSPIEITKRGGGSYILKGKTKSFWEERPGEGAR
ncbi:MAG: FAD-dependent oxidoreductase [Deltaproteobacteria bacterium]|nr:FAD-dependent oxidoreductase [Deltaproteobacteria bacterium]